MEYWNSHKTTTMRNGDCSCNRLQWQAATDLPNTNTNTNGKGLFFAGRGRGGASIPGYCPLQGLFITHDLKGTFTNSTKSTQGNQYNHQKPIYFDTTAIPIVWLFGNRWLNVELCVGSIGINGTVWQLQCGNAVWHFGSSSLQAVAPHVVTSPSLWRTPSAELELPTLYTCKVSPQIKLNIFIFPQFIHLA